jgi:hypothetical protein
MPVGSARAAIEAEILTISSSVTLSSLMVSSCSKASTASAAFS